MSKFGFVAASALLGVMAVVSGCSEVGSIPEASYVHLSNATPILASEAYEVEREFAGLVTARQTSSLGFELAGKVAVLHVDEGDVITAGQHLGELDTELLELAGQELEAQIADMEAQQELNRLDLIRVDALRSKGFTSQAEQDRLSTQRITLAAQIEQLNAALGANQSRLAKSQLIAPYAGIVSRRLVDAGTVVAAGTPLFTLLEGEGHEARVGLPVSALSGVRPGQLVDVTVSGRQLKGRVLTVGQDVTPGSLTVPVRVSLPDDSGLVIGEQVYVLLNELVMQAGYWLPITALTDGIRGLWNVYVAIPSPSGNTYTVERRDIQIAHAANRNAYVYGALEEGDLVIRDGLHRVTPGQVIRIQQQHVVEVQP